MTVAWETVAPACPTSSKSAEGEAGGGRWSASADRRRGVTRSMAAFGRPPTRSPSSAEDSGQRQEYQDCEKYVIYLDLDGDDFLLHTR